jgi:hypothetical protein
MLVLGSRPIKTVIAKQKPDDVAMPRTHLTRVSLEIAPCQWTQPAPRPAQHLSSTGDNLLGSLLTGKKGSGKRDREQRARHKEKRRIASTSLALREAFCAEAQLPLTRRNLSPSRSSGVTPERPN